MRLIFGCAMFVATAVMAQIPGGFGQPAPLPAGVKAERNIPYVEHGHRNQVLDLFLPEKPSDKALPLVI
jgi:hypothetical protein